jgi:ATP-dependent Clp protease ATP-binding subunit ClpC
MKDILRLLGESFAKRIKKQMNLNLVFTEEAYDLILKKGKDEKFGARPLKRALQSMLEDPLADAILAGELQTDEEITIKVEEEKLIFA